MKPKSKKPPLRVPAELPLHHLLPFLMSVAASFAWFVPRQASPFGMLLKCLPILYLIAYIGVTERGRGESGKVLIALIFSVVGDACLVYPEAWFIVGLQSFAVAQIFYTASFGFKGIRLPLGIALYGLGFVLLYFILPHMPTALRVAIPIYNFLIGTMFWRALDRYALSSHLCYERRLSSALGAVLFITSDTCIVFLQMMQLLPHIPSQIIILSTYYSAQLLLMLGSADRFWAAGKAVSAGTGSKKKR